MLLHDLVIFCRDYPQLIVFLVIAGGYFVGRIRFFGFRLNLFIACVGLTAGSQALQALQETGVSLLLSGMIMTLTPMIIGLLFGKFILKLNPVLLFGALTGAGTATAGLNVLRDEADSSAPALGYMVPYAFANVLLTIWGTVIVNLMS